MFYDSYHERTWTNAEAKTLLRDYKKWCKSKGLKPEVKRFNELDNVNIEHVAYHALIQRNDEKKGGE